MNIPYSINDIDINILVESNKSLKNNRIAYLIGCLHIVSNKQTQCQALIITPTKKVAQDIFKV